MKAVVDEGKARQNLVVGVSIGLTCLSVVVVTLRIYTRTFIVRNLGKDDYCMLGALVFTLGYLAAILVLRENGMGYSGTVLTQQQMTTTLQTIVAVEVLYYCCVNSIKVSIVFVYLRIATTRPFENLCKSTIFFLSLFWSICITVVLTQCIPLHKAWDLTGSVSGTCINATAFFYMTSSTNILLDIYILLLPTPLLLRIQRPRHEKYGLLAIFALGVFSCIASIVRLYSIRIYTESKDPFFDSVPINTWSMIEVNLGIWCACIPALKALFSRTQRDRSMACASASIQTASEGSTVGSKREKRRTMRSEGKRGEVVVKMGYGVDVRGGVGVRECGGRKERKKVVCVHSMV